MKTISRFLVVLAAMGVSLGVQAAKTAKVVVDAEDAGVLRFVYDEVDYTAAGWTWYSVPNTITTPAWNERKDVTTRVFVDASFADYRPNNCAFWFDGFTNLDAIIGLERLDVSHATSFRFMFSNCSALRELDLSHFKTSSATLKSTFHMFDGCSGLKTIYASFGFDLGGVTDGEDFAMFTGCTSLVGGAGTAFDPAKTDKTYACPDQNLFSGYFSWEPVAVLSTDGKTLTFYGDGAAVHASEGTVFSVLAAEADESVVNGSGDNPNPWKAAGTTVTKVVFDATFVVHRPKSCVAWFWKFGVLERLEGLENLDLSAATNLSGMFAGCSALTELDVSCFNTSNVRELGYLFYDCSALKEIDVSGFNTELVQVMEAMFCGCAALTNLDLSGFNTANVKTMKGMFAFCTNLKSLDVGSFDTALVADMGNLFQECRALTTLDLSSFSSAALLDNDGMFYQCSMLKRIYATSGFTPSNVEKTRAMFTDCTMLVGGQGTRCALIDTPDYRYACLDAGPSVPGLFTLPGLRTVTFDPNGGTVPSGDSREVTVDTAVGTLPTPTRAGYTFEGWFTLPTGGAQVTAETVIAQAVTFYAIWTEIPISSFTVAFKTNGGSPVADQTVAEGGCATQPVDPERAGYTFGGWFADSACTVAYDFATTILSDLALYAKWIEILTPVAVYAGDGQTLTFYCDGVDHAAEGTVYSVPDAETVNPDEDYPLWHATAAKTVTQVVFDASFANYRPRQCGAWFSDFEKVTSFTGFENLKLSSATNLAAMFVGCSAVTFLDLSSFETSKVVDFNSIFCCCHALTNVNLAGWNTSNANRLDFMFDGCDKLEAVDVSAFDTSKVTTMCAMFQECAALTSLNLAGFKTPLVRDFSCMFARCTGLRRIYAAPTFTTQADNGSLEMFADCVSLVGGNGTSYDAKKIGTSFARLDEAGTPGYFTALSPVPGSGTDPAPGPGTDPVPVKQYSILTAEPAAIAEASAYRGTVFDGYLCSAKYGPVTGTVQVKAEKARLDKASGKVSSRLSVTIVPVATGRKVSARVVYDLLAGGEQTFATKAGTLMLRLGADGLTGSFGGQLIEAVPGTSDDSYVGAYNVMSDEGSFSVSIAKKGKVKVSGTAADGRKVSASGRLLVGMGLACVPVVAAKSGLAFAVWIDAEGVAVTGLTGAVVGAVEALPAGSVFICGEAALAELVGGADYAAYFPCGLAIAQGGAKWIVAPDATGRAAKAGKVMLGKDGKVDEAKLGDNPSALKLSYSAKNGSFKGAFKAYVNLGGKPKAVTVNVTGVMVGNRGYGTATLKKAGSIAIAIGRP